MIPNHHDFHDLDDDYNGRHVVTVVCVKGTLGISRRGAAGAWRRKTWNEKVDNYQTEDERRDPETDDDGDDDTVYCDGDDAAGPRDLEADANDGGRPAPNDLHAVAEAAREDGDREEGHDAAEESEHLGMSRAQIKVVTIAQSAQSKERVKTSIEGESAVASPLIRRPMAWT